MEPQRERKDVEPQRERKDVEPQRERKDVEPQRKRKDVEPQRERKDDNTTVVRHSDQIDEGDPLPENDRDSIDHNTGKANAMNSGSLRQTLRTSEKKPLVAASWAPGAKAVS